MTDRVTDTDLDYLIAVITPDKTGLLPKLVDGHLQLTPRMAMAILTELKELRKDSKVGRFW